MNSQEAFYKTIKKHFPKEENLEQIIPFYAFCSKRPSANFVVYEDWWVRNPKIVISKIGAILGCNNRVFARKTTVKRINKEECNTFLKTNHIYGATKAKHKIGLFLEDELFAVATFSSQRNFSFGRSTELIRFCSKNNTTIVGGLDKLLKFYIREFSPNHIMTYIDKDWGNGQGFLKLGFKIESEKEALTYFVNTETGERFKTQNKENSLLKILNKGSLKLTRLL